MLYNSAITKPFVFARIVVDKGFLFIYTTHFSTKCLGRVISQEPLLHSVRTLTSHAFAAHA